MDTTALCQNYREYDMQCSRPQGHEGDCVRDTRSSPDRSPGSHPGRRFGNLLGDAMRQGAFDEVVERLAAETQAHLTGVPGEDRARNWHHRTSRHEQQRARGIVTSILLSPELEALVGRGCFPVSVEKAQAALADAEGGADFGVTPDSAAYWRGMRDTLRVFLGVTTEAPKPSTDSGTHVSADIAASALLTRSIR